MNNTDTLNSTARTQILVQFPQQLTSAFASYDAFEVNVNITDHPETVVELAHISNRVLVTFGLDTLELTTYDLDTGEVETVENLNREYPWGVGGWALWSKSSLFHLMNSPLSCQEACQKAVARKMLKLRKAILSQF